MGIGTSRIGPSRPCLLVFLSVGEEEEREEVLGDSVRVFFGSSESRCHEKGRAAGAGFRWVSDQVAGPWDAFVFAL